jgi:hypothetical protein
MLHLVMFLALSAAPAPVKNVAPACETYAPRLDGISVTVCDGHVVRACDAAGTCTGR